jgi:hypothetical protein
MTRSPSATAESQAAAESPSRPDERRQAGKWAWVIAAAVAVIGAVLVVALVDPFSTGPSAPSGSSSGVDATGTYTVVRADLSSQTEVSATLGYGGSSVLVNQAQGTVTSLPSVGQVVYQGQVLYEVGLAPVALLYGSTPAFRTLSSGLIGADVAELNADVVALGFATSSQLPPGNDVFTYATERGVERLQASLHVTENGVLALGQAVFAPTAVRITAVPATLGAAVTPGQSVLQATSTTRQVSIALDASQQSEVVVGDRVSISLPNNHTTPGVITSVGTVATAPAPGSSNTAPTIAVLVTPTDPAATGTWDQAPVNVTITTGSVTNVFVVPVDALLAQVGQGYNVEVVGPAGVHHLVPVMLGLFDDADGLVQVSGAGLATGQQIIVPKL